MSNKNLPVAMILFAAGTVLRGCPHGQANGSGFYCRRRADSASPQRPAGGFRPDAELSQSLQRCDDDPL